MGRSAEVNMRAYHIVLLTGLPHATYSASKDTKQYHVALLPPDGAALEPRTLADAFPKLKTGGRKGGR
jgi:hypothetical protein